MIGLNPLSGWVKTATTVLLLLIVAWMVAATALWRIAVAKQSATSTQLDTASTSLSVCVASNEKGNEARSELVTKLQACVGREANIELLRSMAAARLAQAEAKAETTADRRLKDIDRATETPDCVDAAAVRLCPALTAGMRDGLEALERRRDARTR